MKYSTHEDVMKVILNKFEDKAVCKGGGSKISIPVKKFKVFYEMFQVQNVFKRQNGDTYEEQCITLNTKNKT